MKKILLSILAIALTVGVVSGTAYALFSDTVSVAGITMTSGNADLYISDPGTGIPVSDLSGSLTAKLANLFPGKVDYTKMDFRNNSQSEIGLDLTAQLTNSVWTELGEQVYMVIVNDPTNLYINGNYPTSGWRKLNDWRSSPVSFGDTLVKGTPATYKVFIQFLNSSSAVNNAVDSESITGDLVFTGTQHP